MACRTCPQRQMRYCSHGIQPQIWSRNRKSWKLDHSQKPNRTSSGKSRFQLGAWNWHRSELEPVEPERETEPEIWKSWKSGNPEILEILEIWKSTEF